MTIATLRSAFLAAFLAFIALHGAGPTADKSRYTLFNPTPTSLLRDLSTDRPDQTESPYTVDAGHWQLEMDFINYTFDRNAGTRTAAFNIAPINLKLGLTDRADLQFIFDNYSRERVRTAGVTTTTRDWGDLTLRLKINFWGNDGGDTAFALMPFVKLPLRLGDAGNDLVEGGLIVPLAFNLPHGCGLGVMTELDWLADDTGRHRRANWLNSVTVSRDLTKKLGGYVELVASITNERGAPWICQIDLGLTYAVFENVQLDAGCNIGLTRAAPDLQPFLGLSVRY
ncbi:MAG: transporter [Undibacterium sp.]|nr:transporter [Opitutaceae bacterium]